LILNKENIIRYANPAAERIFQKDRSYIIGTHYQVPDSDGQIEQITFPRLDQSKGYGEAVVTKIEWHGQPMTLVSIRDISELKTTQDKAAFLTDENKVILQEKAVIQGQFKQLQGSL